MRSLLICFCLFFDSVLAQQERWFTNLDEALSCPEEVFRLRLKKQDLDSFPRELCLLPNLLELDLSKNKIKSFPVFIDCLLNLEVLTLSRNEIVDVPKEISRLQRLYSLDLWDNNINELPKEVFALKKLTHLDVRGVALKASIYKEYQILSDGRNFFFTEPCDCQEE